MYIAISLQEQQLDYDMLMPTKPVIWYTYIGMLGALLSHLYQYTARSLATQH